MAVILLIVCLALTMMAYASARENSFLQVYGLEIHTFKKPYFVLGIVYDGWESGYMVSKLTIGFLFFNLTFETYKALDNDADME